MTETHCGHDPSQFVHGNEGTSYCPACEALADSTPDSRRYIPAENAPLDVLKLRIETAMTYPHGHPGVPGLPDGGGCPRCNAEHALAALIERAK